MLVVLVDDVALVVLVDFGTVVEAIVLVVVTGIVVSTGNDVATTEVVV